MEKSGVLLVKHDANLSLQRSSRGNPRKFLNASNIRASPKDVPIQIYSFPSSQAKLFFNLTHGFASSYNNFGFRAKSPAPSVDSLQCLETLRISVQKDENAHKCNNKSTSRTQVPLIDCKHDLEVHDPKHRYGTYLRPYYDIWMSSCSSDPFFIWLDEGKGINADASKEFTARLHCVPRLQLDQNKVKYCSEKERDHYQVLASDGKLVWANENAPNGGGQHSLVNTGNGEDRWIFVIDEQGNLYINKKTKGHFHHSSFVSGRPVRAAGRIIVEEGDIVKIGPNSGHYLTPGEQLVQAVKEFFGCGVEDISALCARNSFEADRP